MDLGGGDPGQFQCEMWWGEPVIEVDPANSFERGSAGLTARDLVARLSRA